MSNKLVTTSQYQSTEIGDIPINWRIITAEEFCVNVADGTHDSPKKTDSGKLLVTSKNIKKNRLDLSSSYFISENDFHEVNKRSKVDRWDVLLSMIGTVGEACIIDCEPDFAIKNVGLFKCGEERLAKWLFYFLISNYGRNYLLSRLSGTTQKYITLGSLRSFPIPVPDDNEMESIVKILSSFDDKIELLRQQNETLEKIAQTIFDEWFVDNPNNDWIKKPLDEIAEFLNGVACQKYPAKPKEDKLPVLKIKELNTGITENSDWCSLDVDTKYHVEHGDVIFSWSGTLMIKIWDGEKCVLNQHLFKVSSDKYPKWFYFYWSKHHLDKFIGIAKSKATTMGHIKRSDLSNSLVCVPTDEELKKFDEIMSKILTKKIENMKTISILNNTVDVLLPKLMTGKIRIDADKQ